MVVAHAIMISVELFRNIIRKRYKDITVTVEIPQGRRRVTPQTVCAQCFSMELGLPLVSHKDHHDNLFPFCKQPRMAGMSFSCLASSERVLEAGHPKETPCQALWIGQWLVPPGVGMPRTRRGSSSTKFDLSVHTRANLKRANTLSRWKSAIFVTCTALLVALRSNRIIKSTYCHFYIV